MFRDQRRGLRLVAVGLTASMAVGLGGLVESSPSVFGANDNPARTSVAVSPGPAARAAYDPQLSTKTIEFWQRRAQKDPRGAIARSNLAGAYLARQRETGLIEDAVRAEQAARESLTIRTAFNYAAFNKLATALLTQHRFPEALEVANRALALNSEANRFRADILLELGDYQAARKAFAQIPRQEDDLNLAALQSRFAELEGKMNRSIELLRQAGRSADSLSDMPAEAIAWYHTMVGHRLIDTGRIEEGERSCHQALAVFPRDYRAMTGLAEAAMARHDWQGAVNWGRKAIETSPQNPEAFKILGDAYAELGRTEESEQQYHLLEQLAHSFPRIYDRHWALFCGDKGRHLAEALTLARKDLELRKDVHAYDTLAWVSFRNGLQKEAESAMEKALSQGTAEAPMFQHAAKIAQAGGDQARAAKYFALARAANPPFSESDAQIKGSK